MRTRVLSQGFGENDACIKVDENNVILQPARVISKRGGTCPVGYADFYQEVLKMKGHNGLDLSSYHREKLFFPVISEGKWRAVRSIDGSEGLGYEIYSEGKIAIPNLPTATGRVARREFERFHDGKVGYMHVKFIFWHIAEYLIPNNSEVKAGDLFALNDSTGASSNDHSHWAMKFVDAGGATLDRDNGYYGAVDFREIRVPSTGRSIYDGTRTINDFLGRKDPPLSIPEHIFRAGWYVRGTPAERILESFGRSLLPNTQ